MRERRGRSDEGRARVNVREGRVLDIQRDSEVEENERVMREEEVRERTARDPERTRLELISLRRVVDLEESSLSLQNTLISIQGRGRTGTL